MAEDLDYYGKLLKAEAKKRIGFLYPKIKITQEIILERPDLAIYKDREFPTFIVNHLPIGVKGILIAGVLSAAMSTISSSINSLASSVVNDWLGGSVSLKKSN